MRSMVAASGLVEFAVPRMRDAGGKETRHRPAQRVWFARSATAIFVDLMRDA